MILHCRQKKLLNHNSQGSYKVLLSGGQTLTWSVLVFPYLIWFSPTAIEDVKTQLSWAPRVPVSLSASLAYHSLADSCLSCRLPLLKQLVYETCNTYEDALLTLPTRKDIADAWPLHVCIPPFVCTKDIPLSHWWRLVVIPRYVFLRTVRSNVTAIFV